jgi:hypothetical protein
MTVRATLALTPFVPPDFASETPALRRFREGNRGYVLPSEGRGQRFESSWVRQFSAIFCNVRHGALALPFVSRLFVRRPFTFAAARLSPSPQRREL